MTTTTTSERVSVRRTARALVAALCFLLLGATDHTTAHAAPHSTPAVANVSAVVGQPPDDDGDEDDGGAPPDDEDPEAEDDEEADEPESEPPPEPGDVPIVVWVGAAVLVLVALVLAVRVATD